MTTYINLGCSELEQIPNYVFENTEVKILYLYNIYPNKHRLQSIPPQISLLTCLVEFNIGGNDITILPIEITLLKNLEILDIGNNKLKFLPDLSPMVKLKLLIFTENNIKELPNLPNSLIKLNGGIII